MSGDKPTFASRLAHLQATIHPRERGPFTYEEIADGIAAVGGPRISEQYISQLLRGRRDNPTIQLVEALAKFFGVPAGYFFDDAQAVLVDEEIRLLRVLRDEQVKNLALRAFALSDAGRRSVAAIIEELSNYEEQAGTRSRRRRSAMPAEPESDRA